MSTMSRYQTGSCVVCGQGTDTAVGSVGEAEWHIAFLMMLGIPDDQATKIIAPSGSVSDGVYKSLVRVCADCFAKSPFHPKVKPALYVEGGELPLIAQPA
jgi:hypothetical protein